MIQELLSQHWDKQAVVFLKDVKFDHLQSLVDYMYRGEVNVTQDQLAVFLSTAEALKVKGLANGDREKKNEKRILEKANLQSSSSSPPAIVGRIAKKARRASKDEVSSPAAEKHQQQTTNAAATNNPSIPVLPSLVRIPHITTVNDSNAEEEHSSPESVDQDGHSNNDDMTDNMNAEMEDTTDEFANMVEPKVETEHDDVGEYSGASADEDDWSDTEYPSRNDTSQGIRRCCDAHQSNDI